MKNVSFLLILIISSCASAPNKPTGKWEYVAIEKYFEDKTQEFIQAEKRKSELICENESYKVRVPSGVYDGDKPKNEDGLGSYYDYYSNLIEAKESKQRAERERLQYFVNCMELKGFKRTWIEFES
jgi:hypothetical protein